MKNYQRAFIGIFVSSALFFSLNAVAATGKARVQSIRAGTAQYSLDGQTWTTAQVGTVLQPGAIVKTDEAGTVDLYLGKNGPLVRLTPKTTLKIVRLEITEGAGETIVTTELELVQGKIHAIVRKLSAASKFEVKTPIDLCGVRLGRVGITDRGQLMVLRGHGYVLYTAPGKEQPKRFEVPAGYMFEPTLNNNAGGVIPLKPSLVHELRYQTAQLYGMLPPEERIIVWRPTPIWNIPSRPFVSPGGEVGSGPAWVLPPVLNPTSPVSVGGTGGAKETSAGNE